MVNNMLCHLLWSTNVHSEISIGTVRVEHPERD